MSDFKELSIEELESVNGGRFTDEAKQFLAVNLNTLMNHFSTMKEPYKTMAMAQAFKLNGSEEYVELDTVKDLLNSYGVNNLVDVDLNNPEHLKLLENVILFK